MSIFVNTVDSIGDEALTNSIIDRSITEIRDNYVTSIGNYAFEGCSALTTADFPAATSIGDYAFSSCSELTTADFPAATRIGSNAFYGCSKLTTANFPEATRISASAFYKCSALTTADFPKASDIGNNAFQNCSALTTADFPEATGVSTYTFYGCSALTTADFPKATSIGKNAFDSCSALTTVDFPAATSIGTSAFSYCSALTTADFPAATSIDNSAFQNCPKLTTADFPTVTSIYISAFYKCSALTTVNFPVATSIGNSVFANCSELTKADFPAVTSIGNSVFFECSKLTTLILRSATMATLGNTRAFESTPIASGTGYIYVPAALVDSYKAANNWSTYANQFRAIEDYPEICEPYTWEAVAKHIELGDYATFYKVGDCVPLDLGSEGVVNMQIAAFDADDLADGSGKAAITWVAVELLNTKKRMNPQKKSGTEGTGSIGGWDKCEVREYLQNTIKPLIPSNVSSMIKNVSKTQDAYNTSGALFSQTSNDELWIPSSKDGFVTTSGGILYTKNDRIKYLAKGSSETQWWMRDGCWSGSSFFCVLATGSIDKYQTVSGLNGICLSFCT